MRDITEIFDELREHPDCLYFNAWTKEDVACELYNRVEDYILDEEGFSDDGLFAIAEEDICQLMSDDDWLRVTRIVGQHYSSAFEWGLELNISDLPEFSKRLRREIKIKKIIN